VCIEELKNAVLGGEGFRGLRFDLKRIAGRIIDHALDRKPDDRRYVAIFSEITQQ